MEYALFAAFAAYLGPWILAVARDHPNHGAILALVLGLGWTGLGWLAAWLWALSAPDPAASRPSRKAALSLVRGGLDPS